MLKLGPVVGFTQVELNQLNYDLSECNRALLADSFKALILGATYENTDDSVDTIWSKLSSDLVISRETMANLGFWATHRNHTIAEEDEDGNITCNRPLYDTEGSAARSNTQFHECAHVAGYSHRSSTNYLSVPYQAGNLMEQWLKTNPPVKTA